jgi:hypothetical protein
MDLNFSDEQQQLVDAFGALYAKESSVRLRSLRPRSPSGCWPGSTPTPLGPPSNWL